MRERTVAAGRGATRRPAPDVAFPRAPGYPPQLYCQDGAEYEAGHEDEEYEDDLDSWSEDGSGGGDCGGSDCAGAPPGGWPAGGDGGAACGGDGGDFGGGARALVARWVPYRHTNGVAIYRHPQAGEYMASSIVKVRRGRRP